ncbi:hypothetical protein HMPREF1076_04353 [Parabacteroides goldsteinii CL02T12C30]|uniref:Uncharacterized protein n=1 Tax=Parabacteroides goldsteinii CL02T12C30 TaxID=999418 RepID=K5Z1E4_9BACT|nr:hypothetical protein [Parabacteroides goldsteinii]EKN09324.1 hypothetical protein HMPREF1076_04353 [Parabacteroides goldsteinii CL02T12C30]
MDRRSIVIEIIQKECELYRLKEFGLLFSVESEADRLLGLLSLEDDEPFKDIGCFRIWRGKVISLFYSLLGYNGFLKQHKHDDAFTRFLLVLYKRLLRWRKKSWKGETIDRFLATSPCSLAFKMSFMLAVEANRNLYRVIDRLQTPYELEDRCDMFCESFYPIDLGKLMELLRKDDDEFWNDIYMLIRDQVNRVTSYQLLSNQYKAEIEQDTWSEASLLFHEKVVSDTIPDFESAIHLRNYIIRICQNKCYEMMRSNRSQDVLVEDPATLRVLMETFEDETKDVSRSMDTFQPEEIDVENEYEVKVALAVLLLDKIEPWYSRLVEGIEDKVETFRQHTIEGMSYEEIARLRTYGIIMTDHKLKACLRQEVSRVKVELKKRWLKLLKTV